MTQLEFQRQAYIDACITKAKIEAEWRWDREGGEVAPARPAAAVAASEPPPEETYTYERAAELLGVSVPTLRRWEGSGRIGHAVGPKGGRRVFRRETIDTYLAGRRRAPRE